MNNSRSNRAPGGGFLLLAAVCICLIAFVLWALEPRGLEKDTELYKEGFTHFYNTRHGQAEAVFRQLSRRVEDFSLRGEENAYGTRAHLFLARAEFQLGFYEQSFQTLGKALQYDAKDFYLREFSREMVLAPLSPEKLANMFKSIAPKEPAEKIQFSALVDMVSQHMNSQEKRVFLSHLAAPRPETAPL